MQDEIKDTLAEDVFWGRQKELTILTEAFKRGVRVAVIYGEPGTGKTSFARFFAERNVKLFPGGVHQTIGFNTEYLRYLVEKDISRTSSKSALLLLDEADRLSEQDFFALKHQLLSDTKLRIILTSSKPIDFQLEDQVIIHLGNLSLSEMVELVRRRVRYADPKKARRLWELIKGNRAYANFAILSLRENYITWDKLFAGLNDFKYPGIVGPDGRPLRPESKEHKHILLDVTDANDKILSILKSNPELMRSLPSRKFEEIIAEILFRRGYEVTLTPASRDGGFDMYAAKNEGLGSFLYLVECKRFTPPNRVGVEIVRSLYGVLQNQKATAGVIVTSSFFTSGARSFQKGVLHQIQLQDYFAIQEWLKII